MGKRILFILSLLFLFFAHNSLIAQLSCPLSAPQNVHITGVTPTSIFVEWNSVAGAVSYKISVYDETDQVALPDVFSNVPSVELADLATATHEYTIGVSASACANGPYGAPTYTNYKPGIIIIVDVIVEVSNPALPNNNWTTPAGSQPLTFPSNPNSSGTISTRHIKVRDNGTGAYVEFLVWEDCYQQIRYHEIDEDKTTKTLSEGRILYKLTNTSQGDFFAVVNEECGQGEGFCTAIQYLSRNNCQVNQNQWTIEKEPYGCGERPGDARSQQDTPNPVETAYDHNFKSSTTFPLTMDKNGIQTQESISLKAMPNPFSDLIQIQYEVKTLQQVRIDLMNSTGMLVEHVLPLEWTEKGSYQKTLPIDPRLPAGLYFLVMHTDTGRQVISMIKE